MTGANTTNPVLLFTLLGRLENTIESEDLVLRARKMKSRSPLPPECGLREWKVSVDATRSSIFCVTLPGSRHRQSRQLRLEARELSLPRPLAHPDGGNPLCLSRPLSLYPVSLPQEGNITQDRGLIG